MLLVSDIGCWNAHADVPEQCFRSTELIIQKRDGSLIEEPYHKQSENDRERLYAEIEPDEITRQTTLVERAIAMAFDVLGARHLEVRVREGERRGA